MTSRLCWAFWDLTSSFLVNAKEKNFQTCPELPHCVNFFVVVNPHLSIFFPLVFRERKEGIEGGRGETSMWKRHIDCLPPTHTLTLARAQSTSNLWDLDKHCISNLDCFRKKELFGILLIFFSFFSGLTHNKQKLLRALQKNMKLCYVTSKTGLLWKTD